MAATAQNDDPEQLWHEFLEECHKDPPNWRLWAFFLMIVVFAFTAECARAQTKAEVYQCLLDSGVHHAEVVLAQSIQECGHEYESSAAQDRCNLFGITHADGLATFEDWRESIAAYRDRVQYKWWEEEDYYAFLERIGYAVDPEYCNNLRRINTGLDANN